MRDIAKLLFGGGADEFLGLFGGDDGDGFEMADRARRAGEWCGSTPGSGTAAGVVRGVTAPRGMRRRVTIREWQSH